MDASRIVDSLDEGERERERKREKKKKKKEGRKKEARRSEEKRRFKGEEKNQGWLEFCKGLQTISARLSGFRLSK